MVVWRLVNQYSLLFLYSWAPSSNINNASRNVLFVESFTTPGIFYEIKIDFTSLCWPHRRLRLPCLSEGGDVLQAYLLAAIVNPNSQVSQGWPRGYSSWLGSVGIGTWGGSWPVGAATVGACAGSGCVVLYRSPRQPGRSSRQGQDFPTRVGTLFTIWTTPHRIRGFIPTKRGSRS